MYYKVIQISIMVEIAKIIRHARYYTSGYDNESIEQLAAEMDMSNQAEAITISENYDLIDGARRLMALTLLEHTNVRATIVQIKTEDMRKLMLSLNFTRDKKNFEKIKEALLIYKNVERHQGKKTESKQTPIQKAISISGSEISTSNFYKVIYIERTEKMLPQSNLFSTLEKGDLTIEKAFTVAKSLRQKEKDRKDLEDNRNLLTSSPTKDPITIHPTKPTEPAPEQNTPTIPEHDPSPTNSNGGSTITDVNTHTIKIAVPKRRHIVLSPKCHIINESNWDLQEIEDESLDTSFQSPPYWQQMTYGNADELGQEKTVNEYITNLLKTYSALYKKMKSTGNLLVNLKGTFHVMKNHNVQEWFIIRMGEIGWHLKDTLIWYKTSGGRLVGNVDKAPENSYEPIFWFVKSKDYYYNPIVKKVRTEPITCSVKDSTRTDKNGTSTTQKIFLNRVFQSFKNVIEDNDFNDVIMTKAKESESVLLNKYYGKHPAPFPMCLPLLPALQFCPPGGRTLDSFMGRGAGLVAPLILGHTVYGYELNEKYFDIAKSILADLISDLDSYREQMSELLIAA